MNRRLLLLLMLVPCAIFAADYAFGLGGSNNFSQGVSAEAPDGGMEGIVKVDHATLVGALTEYHADQEALDEAYYEADRRYLHTDNVPAALISLVEKKVVDVLKDVNPGDFNLERSFGRCPSGYHASLLVDADENLTGEGYMVMDQGCWGRPLGVFTYDLEKNTVAARVDGIGLVSVQDFAKAMAEVEI